VIEQPPCYVVNNAYAVARMFLQITADLARLAKGNEVELLELCAVSDLHLLVKSMLVTHDFDPIGAKLVVELKMSTIWVLSTFSDAH
jgi:hypothetical protein